MDSLTEVSEIPVRPTAVTARNDGFTGHFRNETCIDRRDPTIVALSFIPLVALLFNILVSIAVILYRSKLRQNNVYIYVFSVLMSNILFNTLSTYQILNHYYQFEGNTAKEFTPMRGWWVFRQALVVATYLIMVGNIGVLIYAIRAGNYIVAKVAAVPTLRTDKSTASSVQTQRRRAYLLVSLSWCIPLLLALLTLSGWNCSETCECLSACYPLEIVDTLPQRSCSRVMSSLTNSYMGVTVFIWLVEIAFLFFMICKTFSHSIMLTTGCSLEPSPREERVEHSGGIENIQSHPALGGDQNSIRTIDRRRSEPEPTSDTDKSSTRLRRISRKSRRVDRRQRRYARWLRTASKQLAFLTVLFFACTVPAMVCIVVDIFRQEMIPSTTISILIALSLMYTIICPLVLARDLAGLKSALLSLALKFFPSTKINHPGTGTFTSSTVSDSERGQK